MIQIVVVIVGILTLLVTMFAIGPKALGSGASSWGHLISGWFSKSAAGPSAPVSQPAAGPSAAFWPAGWGPARPLFTMSHPASYPAFDSITDNPNFGDERTFLGLKNETAAPSSGWLADAWAKPGDTILVRVLVENSGGQVPGVPVVPQESIQDAHLRIGISQGDGRATVYGVLSAANATTVWDGVTVHFDPGTRLVIDQTSGMLYDNASRAKGRTISADLFGQSGALRGDQAAPGVIGPSFGNNQYITVKLEVSR